jgi:hypothetical protein
MKNLILRRSLLSCLILLSATSEVLQPRTVHSQAAPQSQGADSATLVLLRDLASKKEQLLRESGDLENMAKSLGGSEVDATLELDRKASQGTMALDSLLYFLAIYEKMQCDQDRNVAKTVLSDRLAFYSQLFGMFADQAAGQLAYVRRPAIAQSGQRIKDVLRDARAKMDAYASSLK